MRQWGLGLGLSIVLLLVAVKMTLPGVSQTLPSAPNLENRKLDEAAQLDQQVIELYSQGKYEEAILLVRRVLAIREKALGRNHLDVAISLNNLARLYHDRRKYEKAEPLYRRALKIHEEASVKDDFNTATVLNNLAGLYDNQEKYTEAEPLYKRSLAIFEKISGKDNSNIIAVLNNLAALYDNQKKYAEVESLYQRILTIFKKEPRENNLNFAQSLDNLGRFYYEQGQYMQAEALLHRAFAIREKAPEKDNLAQSLNNLAQLYSTQGKYVQTELLFYRALSILQEAKKEKHPHTAFVMNNLSLLYQAQREDEKATSFAKMALLILEEAQGKEHPNVATVLNTLGAAYQSQGKYDQAELSYQRSLSIREKFQGKDVAISLTSLAGLYRNQRKNEQAASLLERALLIREKILAKDHPDIAANLNNLAEIYRDQEKYEQAKLLYQRSLSISEKKLGKEHHGVAFTINNLALLHQDQGEYKQAESLYKRSLLIREKVFGSDHPTVAIVLNNLATLHYDMGDISLAITLSGRSAAIQENKISRSLRAGSEQDKQDYIQENLADLDFSVSIALQSHNTEADKLASTNVLGRQGRVLDETAQTIQIIRSQLKNRPDLRQQLDDWNINLQEQSDLASSIFSQKNAKGYRGRYERLKQKQQQLEAELSKKSAIFHQVVAPVKLEKVQTLIPQNAALVQIIRYQPFNAKVPQKNRFGSYHYAANILRSTGTPHWVDLGAAAEIEKNIQTFRKYLQDGSNTGNRQRDQIARTLDAQLMQPLRQHLGNTKHLLLSPDSALNLIPFEALKDENNKYLIERYAFSYLTSGRDLTRFADVPPSRQAPVIFSEISYDRSTKFTSLNTAAERKEIKNTFPNAQVFIKQRATKTTLQQIQAPQILHLATHGFFKPAPNNSESLKHLDNPLTRSGIALAGKDQLTGLEAYGLDLYGTQLVVLSACETGLGDISVGEGIYGLRRALVIAGSQSQVLSLWKVGDQATVKLMKTFYANLKAGMGRHEALRQAQLELLRHQNYQNPYNWAAFIPSGNWEPLPR